MKRIERLIDVIGGIDPIKRFLAMLLLLLLLLLLLHDDNNNNSSY